MKRVSWSIARRCFKSQGACRFALSERDWPHVTRAPGVFQRMGWLSSSVSSACYLDALVRFPLFLLPMAVSRLCIASTTKCSRFPRPGALPLSAPSRAHVARRGELFSFPCSCFRSTYSLRSCYVAGPARSQVRQDAWRLRRRLRLPPRPHPPRTRSSTKSWMIFPASRFSRRPTL